MTIDASELGINVNEIPISSQWYEKRFYDFFNGDVTAFHSTPL